MAQLPHNSLNRLALASLIAAALTACGEQTVDEYMSKANTHLVNQEVNAAVIELKNAIQQHPESSQARLMLGKIYLQQGDYASAEKELYKAVRGAETIDDIEPLLARAYLGQKKTTEVIDLAKRPRSLRPDALADLYAMESMALLLDNDPESARKSFYQAQGTGQKTLYTRLAKASLEATDEQPELALSQLESIVQDYPDSSEAWLLKGHIETRMKDNKSAASSYRKAVQTAPKALQNTLYLAQALVKTEQYNEAETYVDQLLMAYSGHALSNEMKATILYAKGEQDEAKVHADLAIRNGSRNLTTYLISGVVAYHQGNYDLASDRLEKLVPFVAEDNLVKRLYASSQLKLGDIEGAMQTLSGFDASKQENSQFISAMSLEFARIGRSDYAISLAEQASEAPSTNTQLRLGLMQLANNDTTGIETVQQVLAKDPNLPEANLGLAYFYLRQGEYEKLHGVVNDWLAQDPNDRAALMLKSLVYLVENKPDQAKAIYQKVLNDDPENLQAKLGLAQIAAIEKNPDTAFQYAQAVYEKRPGTSLTTRTLYRYAQMSNKLDQAFAMVEAQVKAHPDNTSLKLDLARGYILKKEPEQAIQLIRALTPQQQTAQSWRLLGDLYFSKQDYRETEPAYAKWLEMDVLNQQAYVRNIQIKEMNHKVKESIALADKAASLFPQTPMFTMMKAGLQIKTEDLSAAQKTLDLIPENARSQQYFMQLQAAIHSQKKEYQQALEWQLKRYNAYPGILSAGDVASAYTLNQQNSQAIAFLEEVLEEHGDKAAPLRLPLAQLQLKEQPEKAISQYRDVLQKDPNNVVALNNLAWIYMTMEDYKQACDNALKALGLAKEHPQIQDTYGYCLLKSGQTANSLPMLEKAYKQARNNAEIALHYAESLLANQKADNARAILSGVDTSDPELLNLKNKLEKQINL
ncbi:XrtA/PEP-CTERM system TPR-repeat protein PrsT [Photobacterium sp. 1_MG-2023]|uniref:XrtA/PEP-CTERM system TPR-repeat protein PrsT n=1 Tax=Photobacterium sp. 1_MG-2023 TaxID=3062646 RepID=UPI0026E13196|nr:XrtA/PEP-CTERM system TPR-repeat protein PrsT [Photobacterium sp. 1_MG-2023]MDO6705886.1 PEP-CTERM system TPR-repeat protein PrsT [Photobacterium sp. 1_MG-2023]